MGSREPRSVAARFPSRLARRHPLSPSAGRKVGGGSPVDLGRRHFAFGNRPTVLFYSSTDALYFAERRAKLRQGRMYVSSSGYDFELGVYSSGLS